MKKNVKTTGRVRRLAIEASRIIGHKIELYEYPDGKSFQLEESTTAGLVRWPAHTITIREAGLALELLITVAPSIIKTGVMGFTILTPAPISILERYKREKFDNYVQMLTQNELYWCMRSMDEQLDRAPHTHHNHVRFTIKVRKYVYEKEGGWYSRAVEYIQYFICAYKDLALPYMLKRFPL